ncbi:cytoskeleton protein RodZ [Vibrio mimicus]|nr:cytoskeleton protein RodZ [Vibrio mimicus]QXC56929.1 cytoskeleton protein RodZ [Vibrio mimicus]
MTTEQHDYTQPETPEQVIDKVAPGTLLKQKREDLGLTQRQIADRLRLRLSIIQSIEENRFEDGQVATFTRGYLRSYAKAVGIRESEILCAFDDSYCQPETAQPDMKSFSKKTKRQLHDTRIMLITWVVFAVIVGMSTLWWWQNNQKSNLIPPQAVAEEGAPAIDMQPADETGIANEEFATVPPLNDLQNSAPPSEETPLLEVPPTTSESDELTSPAPNGAEVATEASTSTEAVVTPIEQTEAVPVTQPAVTTPISSTEPVVAPVEGTSALLVMNFSSDCWIQVKDATGKTLSTGVKKAGQSISLNGLRPYKVVLGAPEGVSITLASEPVDLSGYTSGKVARLTLP